MFFTLLITLYPEKCKERIKEYLYCLNNNLLNPEINEIIIFFEYNNNCSFYQKLKNKKVKLEKINKRPTFKDFIKYINKYLKNKICIIANSDIYFSQKNGLNLLEKVKWNNTIISLTRYNQVDQIQEYLKAWGKKHDNGILKTHDNINLKSFFDDGRSQDTWIFKSPINLNYSNFNLKIGINHCDLYLNYELLKMKKVNIYNPCPELISIHHQKNWDYNKYKKTMLKGKLVKNKIYRKYMHSKGFRFKFIPFCKINDMI